MGCTQSQVRDMDAPLVHKKTYHSHLHQTKAETYVFQQETDPGYSMPVITVTRPIGQPPTTTRSSATLSKTLNISTTKKSVPVF